MKNIVFRYADENMREVFELTDAPAYRYCKAQGYEHVRMVESHDTSAYFERWSHLAWYMARNTFNYALSLDADAVITEPYAMEHFASKMPKTADIGFARDDNGLCCGVAIIRNTRRANFILRTIAALGGLNPNLHSQYGTLPNGYDQNSIKHLVASYPYIDAAICTIPGLQDYPRTHNKKSFILHAAQRTNAERIEILTPYCK